MIKAGIIGGAGYTGGELLRLLINHPNVEIAFVNSKSNAGKYVYEVHRDLLGDTDLKFSDAVTNDIDVLFLCVGHGDAKKWLDENPIQEGVSIIDLSQDFRLIQNSEFRISNSKFVYGLPELNREAIKSAKYIANPGCFATAIQLALLPLAAKSALNSDIFINATTGSTGAGQQPGSSTHFSWRANNLSVYKAFTHQHLYEITQSLNGLQTGFEKQKIQFIPERGAFTRGILANIVTKTKATEEELKTLFKDYYKDAAFVHIADSEIDLKQVINTNKCLMHIQKDGDRVLITSVIDNLLKGASGQAVQNMNLMFGLDEKAGLRLKGVGF